MPVGCGRQTVKGELTATQAVAVLGRIWGRRKGYVFLPWIAGDATTREARRKNYHEGRAYRWPQERGAIERHIEAHAGDDLYFTPATFLGKRRSEHYLDDEHLLWADLDPVDPRGLGDYRPTIAWESSPGRYQAVWLLNTCKVGASWGGNENHRLTIHLGADPSGWDSTQLLRVPGRRNFKPEYQKDGEGAKGSLLWTDGPRYTWDQFEDLPEVGAVDASAELVDETLLEGIDRHTVWARVRLKVSKRVREFLESRDASGDRSEVLWEIERELADAGCSAVEIIALVRSSVWNKYAGRDDELKRLKVEAAKAVAEVGEGPLSIPEDETPTIDPMWLSDVLARPLARPKWIIKDIWTEGACGFISGAPKSYKSWFAIDMAIAVATGAPFLGEYPIAHRGNVLYLQEEDSQLLVSERFLAVIEGRVPGLHPQGVLSVSETLEGVDPYVTLGNGVGDAQRALRSRPAILWTPPGGSIPVSMHIQTGFTASSPAWQAWLSDFIREHHISLVIIDTLGTTAGEVDTDRAQELITKILRPLRQIAQGNNAAIAIVHHNRKAVNGHRAGQDMLGSVALHAWVDCGLYIRDKDTENNVTLVRESKSANDLSLTVHIEQMDHEHPIWTPRVVPEDVGVEAVEPSPSPSRVGGSTLARRMKQFGKGPHTLEKLNTIIGHDISKQIAKAVENGFIREVDGGYITNHSN